MSSCFQIDVVAGAAARTWDLRAITGHPAAFAVHGTAGRTWTGVCARIAQTQVEPEGLSTYALRVVPALWLLTHRVNHRIFQHLSVPEIVEKLLAEWHIEPTKRLTGSYPKLGALPRPVRRDRYDFVRASSSRRASRSTSRRSDGGETRLVLSDAPQTKHAARRGDRASLREASGAGGSGHVSERDAVVGACTPADPPCATSTSAARATRSTARPPSTSSPRGRSRSTASSPATAPPTRQGRRRKAAPVADRDGRRTGTSTGSPPPAPSAASRRCAPRPSRSPSTPRSGTSRRAPSSRSPGTRTRISRTGKPPRHARAQLNGEVSGDVATRSASAVLRRSSLPAR